MKTLITTTAIALILAAPLSAQTAGAPQASQQFREGTAAGMGQDGYHAAMQQGELLASELLGARVYAPRAGEAGAVQPGARQPTTQEQAQQPATQQPGTAQRPGQYTSRWGQPMTAQDLEGMESIGEVSDLVIDQEGRVQAVLIDVGGFFGVASRMVALNLGQVQFVPDQQDPQMIHVVSMMGADSLEQAPEYDPTMQGRPVGQQQAGVTQPPRATEAQQPRAYNPEWREGRERLAPPAIEQEGYQRTEARRMSADDLSGTTVYDAMGEDVGDVTDVVLGPDGQAEFVVVDVGGFLGIGTHTVALGFDELTVMQGRDMSDLRVYVDVTEASLEAMPEYED